ncbi:hypothetical protein QCA50_017895 [Cerrena zonata]|uniref:RRM domain-containing protein n=1 Tax=Cerrena zonata TaxID=2478898 RepID=A0AAW0FC91_9APHY
MSLQEFFSDESFGGSWADDDIDLASISVPIEKNRPYSSDGGFNNSGGFHGHGAHSGDNGPPYILKLLNLPVTCDERFVDDLFKKSHVIKKVAFVELTTYEDYSKALKWLDLFYKGNRRVIVEPADFNDFQHCISFNQEHEVEIQEIIENFIAGKNQEHGHQRRGLAGMPLPEPNEIGKQFSPQRNNIPLNRSNHDNLRSSPVMNNSQTHKSKSNPFGAARPVDIVSKEKELDDKIIAINHTTFRTIGSEDSESQANSRRSSQTKSRRSSITILKRPSITPVTKPEPTSSSSTIESASPPAVSQDLHKPHNMSLADILSAQGDKSPVSGRRSTPAKQSPKPTVIKPVILKKKTQINLSPMASNQTEATPTTSTTSTPPPNPQPPVLIDEESQKAKELEIENKLKQINESFSKNNAMENNASANESSESNVSLSPEGSNDGTQYKSTQGKPRIDLLAHPSRSTISEPNKSQFASGDRPNFKQHFDEMTKKASLKSNNQAPRNNRNNYQNNRNHGPGRRQFHQGHYANNSSRKNSTSSDQDNVPPLSPPQSLNETFGRANSPSNSPRKRFNANNDHANGHNNNHNHHHKSSSFGEDDEVIENVRALALRDENIRGTSRGRGRGRGGFRGRGYHRGNGYNTGRGAHRDSSNFKHPYVSNKPAEELLTTFT